MNQPNIDETTLPLPLPSGRTLSFLKQPALMQTARGAVENHRTGVLSSWMLGAVIIGVPGGTGVYFLAVSPYVIRVLAPLFQL